jgi:transposase
LKNSKTMMPVHQKKIFLRLLIKNLFKRAIQISMHSVYIEFSKIDSENKRRRT